MFLIMSCLASGGHGAPPSRWLRKHLHDRDGLNQVTTSSVKGVVSPFNKLAVSEENRTQFDPTHRDFRWNARMFGPDFVATKQDGLWSSHYVWMIPVVSIKKSKMGMENPGICIWIFYWERKFLLLNGPRPATTWDDEYPMFIDV